MKSASLLPVLALAAIAISASAAERRYPLADFDRIQIEGPYQVRLTTGLPTSGRASGSQSALDRVSVEVQGSTLRVRPNRSAWGGYPGQAADPPPPIVLTTRAIRAVTISGPGRIEIDKARGPRLDLVLTGNGRLAIGAIDTDALAVTLFGSGSASLAGHAKQAKLVVQGAAEVAAAGLRADDLQLTAETAGPVAIAAGRSAKVRSTGSGEVTIGGTPACTVEALGSGTVRCGR
jgi:hypothetical protein